MDFNYFIHQFNMALDDEIAAVKSTGGSKAYIADGLYLGKNGDYYLYSFSADSELHFIDETAIELECSIKRIEGIIISIEGFNVILGLTEYAGDAVRSAVLYSNPSYLLECLKKRLSELSPETRNTKLTLSLLSSTLSEPLRPLSENTESILASLDSEPGMLGNYNSYQLQAVRHVLEHRISFIWGPPGTGKTRTLALTAAALLKAGEKVLIVAHSNVAVDVAMMNVASLLHDSEIYKKGRLVRFGVSYLRELSEYPLIHPRALVKHQNPGLVHEIETLEKNRKLLIEQTRQTNIAPVEKDRISRSIEAIRKEIEPLRAKLRIEESRLVATADLVGCTFSKASIAREVFGRSFDAVLIDEASMAYIPHCAFVTSLADRRVAVFGDFRQLPPISQSDTNASKSWLQQDIFDKAKIIHHVEKHIQDDRLVLLAKQYRMHPEISAIPNELFYAGLLQDADTVMQTTEAIARLNPGEGKALVLYNTSLLRAFCYSERESYSRFNLVSALVTAKIAANICANNDSRIGIITPYRAQSRLIQKLITDMKLPKERIYTATVHRFQGSESDIILFDMVEGKPKQSAGRLVIGDKSSIAMRLANVAISRARGKFITIADMTYLKEMLGSEDIFLQLLHKVEKSAKCFRLTWNDQFTTGFWKEELKGLAHFASPQLAEEQITRDMKSANEEIAMYWPSEAEPFSKYLLRDCSNKGIRVFISGTGASHMIIPGSGSIHSIHELSRPKFGVIAIDRRLLWMYIEPDSPQSPVLRLDYPEAIQLLHAYWELVPAYAAYASSAALHARKDSEIARLASGVIVSSHEREVLHVQKKDEESKIDFLGYCPACGSPMTVKNGKNGAFLGCSKNCRKFKPMTAELATQYAALFDIRCPVCGSEMKGRRGQSGIFLGCSRYPACKGTKSFRDLV